MATERHGRIILGHGVGCARVQRLVARMRRGEGGATHGGRCMGAGRGRRERLHHVRRRGRVRVHGGGHGVHRVDVLVQRRVEDEGIERVAEESRVDALVGRHVERPQRALGEAIRRVGNVDEVERGELGAELGARRRMRRVGLGERRCDVDGRVGGWLGVEAGRGVVGLLVERVGGGRWHGGGGRGR